MIETEISSSDASTMEEFTPPRFKNRDKQLRILVQIASLFAIALFFSNSFQLRGYEEIIVLLFIGLIVLFLMGLGLSFFQIRYINDRRNKITNLGGIIGLSGLFLTGIPCACELGENVLETLATGLYSSILDILPFILGFGLFLTVIGFFAEATSIDETLIYIIRVNYKSIIRYSATIIGAFLVNLGLLIVFIWPLDLAGGILSLIGILIVWGSWIKHIKRLLWNNRLLMLRTVELSISQALVVLVLIIPIDTRLRGQELSIETFVMIVLLGFAGIIILYTDLFLFGLPERLRDLNRRVIIIFQTIVLISAISLIGMGLLYSTAYFQVPSDQFMLNVFIGSFRVFYVGISLLLIYRMWFRAVNKFMTRTLLLLKTYYKEIITTGTLLPLIYGITSFPVKEGELLSYLVPSVAIVAGYFLGVVVWYKPKHPLSRGINTAFSSVLAFWSLLLVLYRISIPTDFLIPGALFILYLGVDTFLWRKELYHILQQVLKFVKTKYKELVTVTGVGFMVVGSVFYGFFDFLDVNNYLHPLPVVSFIFGYALIMIIWRFRDRHADFRGITTTLSVIVFLWGMIIRYSEYYSSTDLWHSIVSIFYMGTASVISVILWQVELRQLVRQIAHLIGQAFMITIYAFLGFMKAIGNIFVVAGHFVWDTGVAIKKLIINAYLAVKGFFKAYYILLSRYSVFFLGLLFISLGFQPHVSEILELLPFILFMMGYFLSFFAWYRHMFFRRIGTVLSTCITLVGYIQVIYYDNPILWISVVVGIGADFILWKTEIKNTIHQGIKAIIAFSKETIKAVKQTAHAIGQALKRTVYAIIDFMRDVWNAFKKTVWAVVQFLLTNYKEIVTVFSLFSMLLGVVGSNEFFNELSLGLFFLGYLFCCAVWRFPDRHAYFRGITTTLSILAFSWGIILLFLKIEPSSDLFVGPFLITYFLLVVSSVVPIFLWLDELEQLVRQIAKAIKQAFIIIVKAVSDFLKAAWNAFKQAFLAVIGYVWINYKEFVTIFSVSIMLLSSIGILIIEGISETFDLVPLGLFFLGYLVCCAVWRFRIHHAYFRGISTTLSVFAFFWGVIQLSQNVDAPDFLTGPFLITYLLIGVGSVLPFFLWLEEIKQLVKQIIQAIKQAIMITFHAVVDFLKAAMNAFKQAFLAVVEYVKINYREIVTVFSLFSMFLGVVGSNEFFNELSLGLFFLSYLVCCAVWRFRTRHTYFRGITTTVSILVFSWGIILLFLKIEPSSDLFAGPFLITYFLLVVSSVLPIFLWLEELGQLLKQIGSAVKQAFIITVNAVMDLLKTSLSALTRFARLIRDGLSAFGHYIWDLGVAIKDSVVTFFRYVKSLWREILRTSATIVGVFLIYLGIFPGLFLLFVMGLVILYFTWFKQVNEFLKRTARSIRDALGAFGHYIWDIGITIKVAVVNYVKYVISLWRDIIRASATIIGAFLVVIGFYDLYGPSNSDPVLNIGLIILGVVMISWSWRSQFKKVILDTARSIRDALGVFGHYIWDIGVTIKVAVVNYVKYVLNLWRDIIRASATIIGAFLVFFGLYNFLFDSEELKVVNLGLIALGFILISVSWRSQIIELIVKYGKALVNMLGKLAKTIGEIASRIWDQLSQIIRSGIDSSFYIAIVTLGVVALGYGLILLISVFTNDQGAWTKDILKPIFVLGPILWLLASFLQGKNVSEVTDLIGIFANDEPYILFFLGIIFVVFGIALPVIFFFLRESIKISSLRQRSQGSKTKEVHHDE